MSPPVAAVLVPLKGFRRAKARLAGRLDDDARADLAERMAAQVLAAAAPLPVLVVSDDAEVDAWAVARGAAVLAQREPGLNAAVTEGVAHLAASGFTVAVVAHGDLPLATGLAALVGTPGVTLVPDRRRDGTNVLVVPTDAGFTFAYGPGSFARHLAEAHRLGLPVREVEDPALAWDVDEPDDLVGTSPPTSAEERP
ncbi:MAG: 2-phospho-L-lactate guanylyltransferase [Acidimicrobiales bacterium]|nr:2-phospho-L-lactate guanylyltransferase [Acidimicrobiales bacterium]